MAANPSKPRLARALGAMSLVVVSVGVLWIGHELWMTDPSSPAADPTEVHLELASALGDGATRANEAGERPLGEGDRVTMPPGSAVSWSVRVPTPAGGFAAAAIEGAAGPPAATLHVASDDGHRREIALAECGKPCRIPLDELAGRVAHITVRAPAKSGAPLVLVEPVLYGPPTAARATTE